MSEEVKEVPNLLNKAILKVKQELQPVVKGADNPFFKSSYADLNSILQQVEPLLLKNGLILLQATKTNGQFNIVETSISHTETSETIVASLTVPAGITDPQKLGSAITYFRRYTLQSLLGLQTQDDDGNLASGKKKTTKAKPKAIDNEDF